MSAESWKIIIRYGAREWSVALAVLPDETVEAYVIRFLRSSGEVFDPARLSIHAGDAIDPKAMTLAALRAMRAGREIAIVVTDLSVPPPVQSPPPQAPSPAPAVASPRYDIPPAPARAPAGATREEDRSNSDSRDSDRTRDEIFESLQLDVPASEESGSAGLDLHEDSDAELEYEDSDSEAGELDEDSDSEIVTQDNEVAKESAPSVAKPRTRGRVAEVDMEEDEDDEERSFPRKARRAKAKMKPGAKAPAPARRNVLVQYFSRMNPERTYELEVTLSREQIEAAVQAGVKQTRATVELRSRVVPIEIEPILPGCTCYPPRDAVPVAGEAATVKFRVVAHVRGEVGGARIVLRQGKHVLGEIPLAIRVADTLIVRASAAGALFLPFVTTAMKQYELDLDSQRAKGYGLYLAILDVAVNTLRPEGLALILLGLTVVAYLLTRPQKANLEWNLATKTGSRTFRQRLSGGKVSVFYGLLGLMWGCLLAGGIGIASSWARAFSIGWLLVPTCGIVAVALGLKFYEKWGES